MSGVIDACTSYGTHLFWPFSDERVAWHVISIVDPLFTSILLLTFVLGLRFKLKKVALIGLSMSVFYMLFGFMQLQRAEKVAQELAVSRGHNATKHVVKPTLANLFLWRSTYIADQRIYVDAIRLGIVDENRVYEGESVAQFAIVKDMAELDRSTVLYNDIMRFTKFSDDFVAYDPRQKNVLGDIRYSMLPTSINPLWGITIDRSMPDVHVNYHFFRENNEYVRRRFMGMLFGHDSELENEN